MSGSALEVLAVRMLVFLEGLKQQRLCTVFPARMILIISKAAEVHSKELGTVPAYFSRQSGDKNWHLKFPLQDNSAPQTVWSGCPSAA